MYVHYITYPFQGALSLNSKEKMTGSLSNVCGNTYNTCKKINQVRNKSHWNFRIFEKYITLLFKS